MTAALKISSITVTVRRVFRDGNEATFNTTATTLSDALTVAQQLAGTVTLSPAVEHPKTNAPATGTPTQEKKDETNAATAVSQTPIDDAAPEIDYERDIKPKVLKLAADKGRDATAATMARFGVKKAPELNKSQWPEFVRFIDRVLSGEIDPMASIPREEEVAA